jgi:hypothetical protein
MVEEIGNEQGASYRCYCGLSENENDPLPKSEPLATVPDAHTQRYPEQQQQRQNHSMRCSIGERVQPQNQEQPAAKYRPSYEDALNTKTCECVHKSQRSNGCSEVLAG